MVAGLFVVVLVAIAVYTLTAAGPKPLTIAVLGPMSGRYSGSGEAMAAGARLQAERVNANGGINGREIEIETFDTQSNTARAKQLAEKVATSDAVAAVGAYFSSMAVKMAPVFKQQGLPAATGSATTPALIKNNPWYFRVVPDNDSKGRFSALYTQGVLKKRKVNIVYEADAYGKTLYRAYAEKARRLNMQVARTWSVDSSGESVDARLARIVAALGKQTDPGALFVALLGEDSARLVKRLRDANVNLTIIGGDAVGLASFRQAFDQFKDSDKTMADYTQGVYTTTYFLADVANQKAQGFVAGFRERFKRAPRPVAATSYDAVGVIAGALEGAAKSADIKTLRQRIRQHLPRFDSLKSAYEGVTGRIFFDANGGVVKPSTFGVYEQGRLIAAPVQLTPIVDHAAVSDLARLRRGGKVVTMAGHSYYKTDIVYTGIDLNAIDAINTKAATFDADFYLWFRFADNAGFKPDDVTFAQAYQPLQLGRPIASMHADKRRYVAYRVNATFEADYDFHEFPFDRQTLAVSLRPANLQSNRLRLVPDDIGMRRGASAQPPGGSILAHSNAWRLTSLQVFSDIGSTRSTLGNPRLLRAGTDTKISYSRFNLVADVKRLTRSYVLSNLAPLFFVLMLGYAMLYVPVEGPPFTARINLGVLALLTTVSFSLKTSRELPDVGYLVLMDYLYFAVYILLLYGIGGSILKLIWVKQGYTTRVHRLDLISRVMLPLVLVTAVGAIVWLSR